MINRFSKSRQANNNLYFFLLTSVSGLFFRRGVLSWLYLLCYSHLCFLACLAIWPGFSSGLFLVSLAFVGIMTPICFILCLLFFLLGLIGKGTGLFSVFFFFPGGAALGISKCILFFLFVYIILKLLIILFKFLLLCFENCVRSIGFFFFMLLFVIFYLLKYDFIFFTLYRLSVDFITWLYTYVLFLYIKRSKKAIEKRSIISKLGICFSLFQLIYYSIVMFLINKQILQKSFLNLNKLYFNVWDILEKHAVLKNNVHLVKFIKKSFFKDWELFYSVKVQVTDKKQLRENAILLQALYKESDLLSNNNTNNELEVLVIKGDLK